MAGKSKRPQLVLTLEEVQHLKRLRRSRKAPVREVQRADILWRYHAGETIGEIMLARLPGAAVVELVIAGTER